MIYGKQMGNSQRESQIYGNESKEEPRLFYHQGLIIKWQHLKALEKRWELFSKKYWGKQVATEEK